MLGDFNYDTFKTSIYQMNSTDSENFTNILAGFNMVKLIHKPTSIRPPSASLLDNIYTNTQITIDSCKSGIFTSNISDHFFVFGIFNYMKISQTKNVSKIRYFTEKNISKYAKYFKHQNLGIFRNAQQCSRFVHILCNFDNVFPEKYIEIKYKNRHSWMPKSVLKSIRNNHSL